jgi:hypothetical protein
MRYRRELAGLVGMVTILLGAGVSGPRTAKLLKGRIVYTPPEGWELSIGSSDDTTGAWSQPEGSGILAIQALPGNAVVDKGAGRAIVRQLHENHLKAKDEIVLEPRLEDDDRFSIRIHEKYKRKGQLSDEMHYYKMVGSRACMLTVNAVTDDEADAKKVHAVGEAVLLSARFAKVNAR